MLTGGQVNPFDSQETKPYRNDNEIKAMTDLVDAYQRREVHTAEKILKDNRATIMDDAFIRSYIGDLLRSLRTQYLIDLIRPYTRLELSFLAKVTQDLVSACVIILYFYSNSMWTRLKSRSSSLDSFSRARLKVASIRSICVWSLPRGMCHCISGYVRT